MLNKLALWMLSCFIDRNRLNTQEYDKVVLAMDVIRSKIYPDWNTH